MGAWSAPSTSRVRCPRPWWWALLTTPTAATPRKASASAADGKWREQPHDYEPDADAQLLAQRSEQVNRRSSVGPHAHEDDLGSSSIPCRSKKLSPGRPKRSFEARADFGKDAERVLHACFLPHLEALEIGARNAVAHRRVAVQKARRHGAGALTCLGSRNAAALAPRLLSERLVEERVDLVVGLDLEPAGPVAVLDAVETGMVGVSTSGCMPRPGSCRIVS